MVTDYDCWREGHDAVTIEEIVAVLPQERRQRGQSCESRRRRHAVHVGCRRTCSCASAAKYAVLTQPDAIPAAAKERLKLLFANYLGW